MVSSPEGRLPPEVWNMICSSSPLSTMRRDLASLCRCSWHLLELIRPILYRGVILDQTNDAEAFNLLASDEHLASRVLRFEYQDCSDEETFGLVDLIISMKSLRSLIVKGRLLHDASEQERLLEHLREREMPLDEFHYEVPLWYRTSGPVFPGEVFNLSRLTSIIWKGKCKLPTDFVKSSCI